MPSHVMGASEVSSRRMWMLIVISCLCSLLVVLFLYIFLQHYKNASVVPIVSIVSAVTVPVSEPSQQHSVFILHQLSSLHFSKTFFLQQLKSVGFYVPLRINL